MITRKPVILLAPLDWGFGHTIRCIPIVRGLIKQNCDVLVACNSEQKQLLSKEISSIRFVDLPGYNIYYGKSRLDTLFSLFRQAPKILTRIKTEQLWLRNFLSTNNIDAVISDNRYGLFTRHIPCVFITHQLSVRSGFGTVIDKLLKKRLYSYINKFSVCWVPDWINPAVNAGGRLSHPKDFPKVPVKYIGCLSRLEKCVPNSKTTDLLMILSGPEPQRTVLEKILLRELQTFKGTAVLVRGVMDKELIASVNNISILNYVSSEALNTLLCSSSIVISRAGYTSIMDILKLGKQSILIPTPGQAEQEYLAVHMHRQGLALMADQQDICLQTILETVKRKPFKSISDSMDLYISVIREFTSSLKAVD